MHAARRFVAIGIVSTLAYLALYFLLRDVTSAQLANAAALLITAVGNTAANRRFTFGVRGRDGVARDHLGGLLAFAVALAITTSAIGALHLLAPRAGRTTELLVLVAANVLATLVRFLVLRAWIARPRRGSSTPILAEGASR
jgi:putative flippase GtrA